jgi:major type 1 subunit fimbrin (pilin)
MKMKHLGTLILSATAALAGTAHASDGKITFTGSIDTQTCKIGDANPTITLPTVNTTALATDGTESGATPFNISLSGCAPGGKVHTFFETGNSVDTSTGYLKNTGDAKNVEVALKNGDDASDIKLGQADGSQNSKTVDIDKDGNATLGYFAKYHATGAAEAGKVSSNVEYSMSYE